MATKPNLVTPTDETGALPREQDAARQWHEHEHTSGPAAIEAQKLVDVTGSVELAKQALDAATESIGPNSREGFAQRLGFASFLEMFEASKPTTDANGRAWYLTPDQAGKWLAWNERDLTVGEPFSTSEEAIAWVQRNAAVY